MAKQHRQPRLKKYAQRSDYVDLTPLIPKIEEMAALGLRVQDICLLLDISDETYRKRVNDNPALKLAVERGRAVAESNVSKTAYEMAKSGAEPAMTMFWLKCRAGWRERDQDTINLGLVLNQYGVNSLEDLDSGSILGIIKEVQGREGPEASSNRLLRGDTSGESQSREE